MSLMNENGKYWTMNINTLSDESIQLETIVESDENTPPKGVETSEVNNDRVVSKLFIKGKASHLRNIVDVLLQAYIPSTNNPVKTKEFILTLMLEEIPKV